MLDDATQTLLASSGAPVATFTLPPVQTTSGPRVVQQRRVVLQGLVKQTHLNGCAGVCHDDGSLRPRVHLDNGQWVHVSAAKCVDEEEGCST